MIILIQLHLIDGTSQRGKEEMMKNTPIAILRSRTRPFFNLPVIGAIGIFGILVWGCFE